MGKITIHKWQCDRCGVIQDEPPKWLPGCSSRYTLRASVDHGTCGGLMIEWADLCHSCNDYLGKQIDALIEQTKEPS